MERSNSIFSDQWKFPSTHSQVSGFDDTVSVVGDSIYTLSFFSVIDEQTEINEEIQTASESISFCSPKVEKYTTAIGYIFGMFVCGSILVMFSSSLDQMASNVDKTATQIGISFLPRMAGAIFGSHSCAFLYEKFRSKYVIFCSLTLLTLVMVTLPYNRSDSLLYVYFGLSGLATSITDTGCQMSTRRLHKRNPGYWMGLNLLAFSISGVLSALLQSFTHTLPGQASLQIDFSVLGGIAFLAALWMILAKGIPLPSEMKPRLPQESEFETVEDPQDQEGTRNSLIELRPSTGASSNSSQALNYHTHIVDPSTGEPIQKNPSSHSRLNSSSYSTSIQKTTTTTTTPYPPFNKKRSINKPLIEKENSKKAIVPITRPASSKLQPSLSPSTDQSTAVDSTLKNTASSTPIPISTSTTTYSEYDPETQIESFGLSPSPQLSTSILLVHDETLLSSSPSILNPLQPPELLDSESLPLDQLVSLSALRPSEDDSDQKFQRLTEKNLQNMLSSTSSTSQSPSSSLTSTKSINKPPLDPLHPPHIYVEIIVGVMLMGLVGGNNAATAYLKSYCSMQGVIPSSSQQSLLIAALWGAITAGRFLGIFVQVSMTSMLSLAITLSVFAVLSSALFLAVLFFPNNPTLLWTAVVLYGVFTGPSVSLSMELLNRCTFPTPQSMSIVMVGLNVGASLLPYLASLFLTLDFHSPSSSSSSKNSDHPLSLIYLIIFSTFFIVPEVLLVLKLKYRNGFE